VLVSRLVAFVLMQALVVSTATATSLHVHEYIGHDHPEHHHGPASHEHQHSSFPDSDHHDEGVGEDDPAIEAGSCGPGRHAVAVTFGCVHVPQIHVEIAEVAGPTVIAPTAPIRSATSITEVRVHGPPFDIRIPSRAPPLNHLA
jgi:hypothetical protein